MEDPVRDIKRILPQLVSTNPQSVERTLRKYARPDMEFLYTVFWLRGVEEIIRFYQGWSAANHTFQDWEFHDAVFSPESMKLYLDVSYTFQPFFSPTLQRARLIAILTLSAEQGAANLNGSTPSTPQQQRQQGRPLYYIKKQEDFYRTPDIVAAVVPAVGSLAHVGTEALLRLIGFWTLYVVATAMFLLRWLVGR